ncbi:hypothetical protein ACFWNF_12590 [Streptomyces anulatus]|uniref:hypothetical protein n=1 Tax=Streptomyces anulatus TaxID=1892 RepID=UPI003665EC80
MDAGLAAVLGALAGSVGTVVAAVAQREAVRITARAQQRNERRQPRHDAYKAFAMAVTEVRKRVSFNEYEDTTEREEEDFRNELYERWIDLSLMGPESVVNAGSELLDEALKVVFVMGETRYLGNRAIVVHERSDSNEEEQEVADAEYNAYVDLVWERARGLMDSITAFSLVSQSALDDDGTKRQRVRRRRILVRTRVANQ